MSDPALSIVVIFHDMRREAQRTLLSLSAAYQRGVSEDTYEIIAIDNGSNASLNADEIQAIAGNIRYVYHETQSASPVEALNLGGRLARGRYISLIVDGARMASPGLVRATLDAASLRAMPFLCSLSWHLGPDVQNNSILDGYCQSVEDGLLGDISWPEDGYRLFEISALAQSSRPGFLGGFPSECSWLCLSRDGFERLGGYDPAFVSPGGGLANQDIVVRAAQDGGFDFIVLLGEGVFHQIHGGVATNVEPDHHPIRDFRKEYRDLRGVEYNRPSIDNVVYFGVMPASARRFIAP